MKPWLPGIAGVALLIGGGVCFGLGKSDAATLQNIDPLTADATVIHSTRLRGEGLEKAGVGLFVAGGVGVAASAIWLFLARPQTTAVTIAPLMSGGAMVSLNGRLP